MRAEVIEAAVAVVVSAGILVALWRYGRSRDQTPDTSFRFGLPRAPDPSKRDGAP